MTAEPVRALRVPPERRRYERVVDSLLELIESRGLGPGDAMPTERELADLFGVSRNVLRQAFSVLEERGLLSTLQGSGRYFERPKSTKITEDVRNSRSPRSPTSSKPEHCSRYRSPS